MELRRFRYFVATAEELHVGRAAEKLGIAQPALSQQIKVLEAALGVRLFHRVRRGIELTDAGAAFLKEARAVLGQAEKAVQIARRVDRGELGQIEIGYVGSAMMEPHLPRLIGLYRERYPSIELRFTKMAAKVQIEAINDNRLDIGFVRGVSLEIGRSIRLETFSRVRLVAALPASKAAMLDKNSTLAALAEESFIVLQDTKEDGFFAQTTVARCEAAGFKPKIVLRVGEISSLIGLVASGQGVGLVPDLMSGIAMPNVEFRTFPELHTPIELYLVSRADTRSLAVKNLLESSRNMVAEDNRPD
ncbi:MAG: LysR substrate-binding domain-containing protein [Bradyrhizobium sp.]|nr:LysR substrate-binding domain-containing protein [Bradyrhizobium sp.]